MTGSAAALTAQLAKRFEPDPPRTLGVAVSGGSDSLALLFLCHAWRDQGGPELAAVTVDHGLRAEALDEANDVARICKSWDIPHDTLRWTVKPERGNISDAARRARYALMADWARGRGIDTIALGHTADDQAETFLMRLGREAGVDGLSAMAPRWTQDAVTFARPLLGMRRETLRELLRSKGLAWADDPTNEDEAYDRARARKILAALVPLGIDAGTLAATSRHLASARATLNRIAARAAADLLRFDRGDILIDRAEFAALEPEIARRIVKQAIVWISGPGYPPRGEAVDRFIQGLQAGRDQTLQGCRAIIRDAQLRLAREAAAVIGHSASAPGIWDRRWQIDGPQEAGFTIGPLTEAALGLCPDRRDSGLPAATLAASPAVWQGDTLVAAPLAGLNGAWTATLLRDKDHYFAALIAH